MLKSPVSGKNIWEKYIENSRRYDIKQDHIRWHVKHAEQYIKAHKAQLKTHTALDLDKYLQDEDGTRRWMQLDTFRQEYGWGANRGTDGDLVINGQPHRQGSTRGPVKWMIKALNFIGIDVAESAASGAVTFVAEKIESKLKSPNRDKLFRLSTEGSLDLFNVSASQISTHKPILLFIHGTFSSTLGSYGDLWSSMDPEMDTEFHPLRMQGPMRWEKPSPHNRAGHRP